MKTILFIFIITLSVSFVPSASLKTGEGKGKVKEHQRVDTVKTSEVKKATDPFKPFWVDQKNLSQFPETLNPFYTKPGC